MAVTSLVRGVFTNAHADAFALADLLIVGGGGGGGYHGPGNGANGGGNGGGGDPGPTPISGIINIPVMQSRIIAFIKDFITYFL